MNMGERIKQLRISANMTQEELGDKVGVKKAAVNKWESGLTENLKRSVIQKLSELFNVTPSYLMGMEDEEYYLNLQTKKIAQEIFSSESLKALFDASRDATPEDLEIIKNLLISLKNKEKR